MKKFYLIKFDKGQKFYAQGRGICGRDRRHASLFTEVDWIQWGESEGYEREELGEDQLLRAGGAKSHPELIEGRLPGLE